jgi:hypothetical protein
MPEQLLGNNRKETRLNDNESTHNNRGTAGNRGFSGGLWSYKKGQLGEPSEFCMGLCEEKRQLERSYLSQWT